MAVVRDNFSAWILLGIFSIFIGVALDAGSLVTEAWGTAEGSSFTTTAGLWRICNTTTETIQDPEDDEVKIDIVDTKCMSIVYVKEGWFRLGVAMEILGALCSLGALICVLCFLACSRQEWIRNRAVVTALAPISILAASFNFIGCFNLAYFMDSMLYMIQPDYSVALDALGMLFLVLGGIFCLFDLQGIGMKKRPAIGKGLARPI